MAPPRQRQTRLTFTPLPSSSPAAKGYHQQIQHRAAAVSYDSSPSPGKRRKLVSEGDLEGAQTDGATKSIPTPAASLERSGDGAENNDDEEDSESIKSTQRRPSIQGSFTSHRRARQQQLDFSQARDVDSFSPPQRLASSPRPQSSTRSGMFGTQIRQRDLMDLSSDEDSDVLPSPGKLMMGSKERKSPKRNTGGSSMNKARSQETRGSQKPKMLISGPEDDNIVVSSHAQPDLEGDDDGNEDMPTTLGKQPRRRTRLASKDSYISSSPPRVVESDGDLEMIEKPSSKRRRPPQAQEEDDDESDNRPITPSRRRLKRPRHMSRREREDLENDLEDLEPDSSIENSARKARSTQSAQKCARQKALEKLKRQRSGQHQLSDDAQDEMEGDDHHDELYYDDNEGPQITSSRQMFNSDEDDGNFIDEEDEEGPLGVPAGMPLKYTRYATLPAKELFKFVVEWMVQKKLNPAFQMTDEIYELSFRRLNDEVKGLGGSKFTSAAWTPQFNYALHARPGIAFDMIDRESAEHFMRDKCDACNRSHHPATWQIQFQGKPYDRETLEEVGANEDEEDDEEDSADESDNNNDEDEDDQPTWDAEGREILPANTIFYVGKFCMANAETAHALQHWRHHLYEWVVDYLVKEGYNTPEKIVERDRWTTKKRRKYSNKIADRMERNGEVNRLWRDFRNNINEARSSKQGRFGYDSP